MRREQTLRQYGLHQSKGRNCCKVSRVTSKTLRPGKALFLKPNDKKCKNISPWQMIQNTWVQLFVKRFCFYHEVELAQQVPAELTELEYKKGTPAGTQAATKQNRID
jgi:hypothetical protein